MRLEARDISFKYGKGTRQILDHVNLAVEPGESVGIMAPSGYGKTTLCKILAGYESPDSGEVLVDGMPVLELHGYCPVQMVWQHPELSVNPKRRLSTVLEEGDWTFENPSERARIEAGLGIRDEWKDRFPVEVSGGELPEILYCESVGATDGASDRGRDDDDAGPYYTGADLGFCLEGTEAPGDGDDCGEPFAGASGEGV